MKRFVIALTLLAGSFSLFGASATAPAPIKTPVSFESPQQAAAFLIQLFEDYSTEVDPTSAADRATVEKMLTANKHNFELKCHSFGGKIHIKSLMEVLFNPKFNSASKEEKFAAIARCFSYRKKSVRSDIGSLGRMMKGLLASPGTLLPAMKDDEDESEEEETLSDSETSAKGSYDSDNGF